MVVGLAAVLVACGGGGDDAGDGGNGGEGGTGSRVHRYVTQGIPTTTTGLREGLNAQGALGYRYIGLRGYTSATPDTLHGLYVNDAAVAYTYEVLPTPAAFAAFVGQVQAQGLRGFRLVRHNAQDAAYVKVTNSTETFTYELGAGYLSGGFASSEFVGTANLRGVAGFRFHSQLSSNGEFFDLYEKSSVPATYAVRVEDVPADEGTHLARFDTNGQAGYRWRGVRNFADGSLWVFEKNTTQANAKATFRYFSDVSVNNIVGIVAQANTQGALGRGYDGPFPFGGGTRNLYVLAANCSGVLCDVRGPLE
jgi:hypothetical protein